jgi:hypothetical protein
VEGGRERPMFFFELFFKVYEWLEGSGFFFKNMLKGDGKGRGLIFFYKFIMGEGGASG